MAITFPLELPSEKFVSSDFDLSRWSTDSTTNEGAFLSMELADPLWIFEATTEPKNQSDFEKWKVFKMLLRDGAKRFYGYDPRRCYPKAYGLGVLALTRHGGGAFNGSGVLVSASGAAISVNTMPDGYLAKAGDYLSIHTAGALRSLHMVMQDAAGNGSGVLAVTVEPLVTIDVTAGAQVDFIRPKCLMALTSFSGPRDGVTAPISLKATQVLVE